MTGPVGICGLWHLGSVTAAALLERGAAVVGWDPRAPYAAAVAAGSAPLAEPGVDAALAAGRAAGRLAAGTDAAILRDCAVVCFAFDTPVDERDAPAVDWIEARFAELVEVLAGEPLVIVSAQAPAGTGDRWRARLRARLPGAELVVAPENLRLGRALADARAPRALVLGAHSAAAAARAAAVLGPGVEPIVMRPASAELAKHAVNAVLGTAVVLGNALGDVAEEVGADMRDVLRAVYADGRIAPGTPLRPGLPFAGGTLGRDLQALAALAGADSLFGAVWADNHARTDRIARRIAALVADAAAPRVGLWGLTYKAGTSTLRRSAALEIAAALDARGVAVVAHDPAADFAELPARPPLTRVETPLAACHGADLLVLVTPWEVYRAPDWGAVAGALRRPRVLDTAGLWETLPAPLELLRPGVGAAVGPAAAEGAP